MADVDFNGDQNLDLALGDGSLTLDVLLGDGKGSFTVKTSNAPSFSPLAAGDFNGDGLVDLAGVVSRNNSSALYLGDGRGGFVLSPTLSDAVSSMVPGDFSQDHLLDLAIAAYANNSLSMWLGTGIWGFHFAGGVQVGTNLYGIAAADFDGDGQLDIATVDQNGTMSILLHKCN